MEKWFGMVREKTTKNHECGEGIIIHQEADISCEGKDSGSGNTSRQNNNQKIKVCSVDNFFFFFFFF